MKITNDHDINLLTTAWLLSDDYDYINEPNYYSVTSLMKPTKQVILARRIDKKLETMDVSSMVASAMGSAVHNGIEHVWTGGAYKSALKRMGIPQETIDAIRVNPTEEEASEPGIIPIYFERRGFLKLGKFTLGGKFDVVAQGVLEDFKSTSTYSYMKGNKDGDYIRQLSSYRAIHSDVVTEDYGRINFIFTDWQGREAKSNPNYPAVRTLSKIFELEDPEFIKDWAFKRMTELDNLKDAEEDALPRCTDEQLWRSDPVYKFYLDPTKVFGGRATKNFTTFADAQAFQTEKGGRGTIITVPGEVKACGYCPAFPVCKQKDEYL